MNAVVEAVENLRRVLRQTPIGEQLAAYAPLLVLESELLERRKLPTSSAHEALLVGCTLMHIDAAQCEHRELLARGGALDIVDVLVVPEGRTWPDVQTPHELRNAWAADEVAARVRAGNVRRLVR